LHLRVHLRVLRNAAVTLFVGLVAINLSCGAANPPEQRYSKEKLAESLSVDKPGLLIGEFELPPNAVVDGDTIKVNGLDASLRLLAIDSEETFKNEQNRRDAADDFLSYYKRIRGTHRRPRKTQTPMGEEAKKWAQDFFEGTTTVRLERDHPKEIKGRFKRYLVYVFVEKNGNWINYNLEHVRAGMSPYFTKYSYSRRFHDQFVAAENEARAAKRGIWNPEAESNKDYDERTAWWNARADFIKLFEDRANGRNDYIVLTHWDAMDQLAKHVDQEVSVLALVSSIRQGKRGPVRIQLSRRLFDDLTAIIWDREVFAQSGVETHKGEYVVVKGIVQIYENKYRKRNELQLVVKTPSQITRSRVPGIPMGETVAPVVGASDGSGKSSEPSEAPGAGGPSAGKEGKK